MLSNEAGLEYFMNHLVLEYAVENMVGYEDSPVARLHCVAVLPIDCRST